MIPVVEARRSAPSPHVVAAALEMNSDFGALDGDALGLVERRYSDRGLVISRERYSSRSQDGDIVCTGRDGDRIVGTLSVRFDGKDGLHADLLFKQELDEWRAAGVTLCE